MGPAVFPGSPPTHNTQLVPPGVCGSWPLLAVWDPRFSRAHRQPTTHIWSLLECAASGRSSQYGTRCFPGLTANPTIHIWSLLECAASGRSSQYGTRGFPGLTSNPQYTFGPSWSVRLLAAPRSMGPAVFPGSPPTHNTHLVPPGVCGFWSLLAVWDPRFSRAHRQPTIHIWSLLECAASGRSSQYGTRGFPGLTANPQYTFGPSWSVRLLAAPRSMGPAVFTGSPPTHNRIFIWLNTSRKEIATQVLGAKMAA